MTSVKPKRGLATQAAMFCNNRAFRKFLKWKYPDHPAWAAADHVPEAEIAAKIAREHCGIQSRAELDSNPEAAKKFHAIMRDYNRWFENEMQAQRGAKDTARLVRINRDCDKHWTDESVEVYLDKHGREINPKSGKPV